MDKTQSLHRFFSSFGWKAWDENTVPDDAQMPYITYEVATGKLGGTVYFSASLWARDISWETISKKADEIAEELDQGGTTIKFDGGVLWIVQGMPFSQRMADDDPAVRRILLNFAAEYLSAA